jgi:hypothetical protein
MYRASTGTWWKHTHRERDKREREREREREKEGEKEGKKERGKTGERERREGGGAETWLLVWSACPPIRQKSRQCPILLGHRACGVNDVKSNEIADCPNGR